MFFERSAQRIFVGASSPVISNSRLVVIPASLTVLWNTVPTPVGPSGVLAISWTRGLNLGSLVPSARKANTSSTGRSILAAPSKRPPATSAPRHRGEDLHLGAVGDRRLQTVEVADVLAADVDVDEAPQPTLAVGDPLAQLAVRRVDRVQHFGYGAALSGQRRLAADRGAQLGWQLDGDRHQAVTATWDSNAS